MLTFRCDVLSSDLTRKACGERHERARREQSGRPKPGTHLVGSNDCARCELGAAHARGEEPETWPDDGRVVVVGDKTPSPASSRWVGTTSDPEQHSDPPGSRTSPPSGSGLASGCSSGSEDTPRLANWPVEGSFIVGPAAAARSYFEGVELVYVSGSVEDGRAYRAGSHRTAAWIFEVDGELLTARAWAERIEVTEATVHRRYSLDWTVRQAVTTPARQDPAPRGPAPVDPVELLRSAGFVVTGTARAPGGLVIVVKGDDDRPPMAARRVAAKRSRT